MTFIILAIVHCTKYHTKHSLSWNMNKTQKEKGGINTLHKGLLKYLKIKIGKTNSNPEVLAEEI